MKARALAVALVVALNASAGGASGQAPATSVQIAGLSNPVEIIRDHWGINHIYAQNEADLFFAQGYAAAKDRLFQFEIWRRQATGTVAEVLGKREVRRDHGARLHRFRGDLDEELNRYHPRGKLIVESYVRGVNAYITETERSPALLPIEFRMLGITPGRWTPAVVISRHQSLAANVTDEARLVRAIRAVGIDDVRDLQYFQGGEPQFWLDPSIDPKTFPDDVLGLYSAFRAAVQFRPEDVAPEFRGATLASAAAAGMGEAPDPAGSPGLDLDRGDIGSNNWVVSGDRTVSKFPILANDPHRVIAAPSLRYWVHLVAPGWNVIGGGEPVLPGVSIGHNEHGAWGLTIFGQDAEDLYVYDTNPANPNEYRYRDGWEAMRVIVESIPVEGEKPEPVELKYTRHGPVLSRTAPIGRRTRCERRGWSRAVRRTWRASA